MLKNGFIVSSLESCCKTYYDWAYDDCLVEGGEVTTAESGKFYVDYNHMFCVQDCLADGNTKLSTCTNPGGTVEAWQEMYETAAMCCKSKLWWMSQEECIAQSGNPTPTDAVPQVGSLKYAATNRLLEATPTPDPLSTPDPLAPDPTKAPSKSPSEAPSNSPSKSPTGSPTKVRVISKD